MDIICCICTILVIYDYIEEEAMIQTFDAFLWNADLLQIATTILRARNQSLTKR